MNAVGLHEMMTRILDGARGNPADYEEWTACGQDSRKYTGWNVYTLEAHCALWRIVAKKAGEQWVIKEFTVS